MKDILIITVNYKNTSVTNNFIKSIENIDYSDRVQLVILDNEATDKSRGAIKDAIKNSPIAIKDFYSARNLYYWGGVAHVLDKLAIDFDSQPPIWIIVCNNDIIFKDKLILKKLLQNNAEKYTILAPSIISSKTGKDLNPYMLKQLGIIGKIYYKIFYLNHISALLIYTIRRKVKKIISQRKKSILRKKHLIYAPHGAFMIFPFQYFIKGGFIDKNFTLYGEELTIAETAKILDFDVVYTPALKVIHVEHSSTDKRSWKNWFDHSKASYNYIKSAYFN